MAGLATYRGASDLAIFQILAAILDYQSAFRSTVAASMRAVISDQHTKPGLFFKKQCLILQLNKLVLAVRPQLALCPPMWAVNFRPGSGTRPLFPRT